MTFDRKAYGAKTAELRVAYLAACIDIAAHERPDFLTGIEEISTRLAQGLWPRPTTEEWNAAYKASLVFQAEYPDDA